MSARILIVDDNVNLTTLLAKTLARFGFEPYVENNSVLAFGTIQRLMPDIILLDVMMPEKDGGKVLAEISSDMTTSAIPVILLTGLAREAQGLADMYGLDSQVIGKPVELKVLLAEIERQLAKGRSYHEQLSHDSDTLQEQQLRQQLEDIGNQPGDHRASDSSNPFFTVEQDTPATPPPLQDPEPVQNPLENPMINGHHNQPDFKAIFSNLPPLKPRPGFGPQAPAAPHCAPDNRPTHYPGQARQTAVPGPPNPFSSESAPPRPATPNPGTEDPIPAKGRW